MVTMPEALTTLLLEASRAVGGSSRDTS